MIKSILCVIDFSESSLNALKWAAEFSQHFKSHLHIVYTYRLLNSQRGSEMVQYKKETEALAIKKFDAIEKDVLTGKHISFDFKPEVGFLTDRVEDNLGRNSPDLLVMSKNVHSTNKENFDDLVKAIKIPLVLVS